MKWFEQLTEVLDSKEEVKVYTDQLDKSGIVFEVREASNGGYIVYREWRDRNKKK